MPPKKKKENPMVKVIILVVILVAVGLVLIFFTLPALGVNLFSKKATVRPATNPVIPITQGTTGPYTSPVLSMQISVETALVKQSISDLSAPKKSTEFDSQIITPYIYKLDNPEEIRRLLTSKNSGVAEVPEITFISCFVDKNGEKTGWIRIRSVVNEIIEIKVNAQLPGYPDTQIIDINEMGVLVYRYPDVNKKAEEQKPQLLRILSKAYRDVSL
jgi:hypothetical protein